MPNEYINNKIFETIIIKFQHTKREKAKYELLVEDNCKIQKELDVITGSFNESQIELANAFYVLSENIVRYAKFNLIDTEDAVQDSVLICFEKIDRFDPSRGKGFNYFTTCVLNSLRQMYRTARNYNELKRKYMGFLEKTFENTLNKHKSGQRQNIV